MAREYYNVRHGHLTTGTLNLHDLADFVVREFEDVECAGYFHQSFGFFCDERHEYIHGQSKRFFSVELHLETGLKVDPFPENLRVKNEGDIFTFLEFVHDYIAKPYPVTAEPPCQGRKCDVHYHPKTASFDKPAAQLEWRQAVNPYLKRYKDGYELSPEGEVRQIAPQGFEDLLARPAPEDAPPTNAEKLDHAIRAFRRANASRVERKQAVRELADLLEFYKESVMKEHLTADANELFNIVNNFSIRHHHEVQRDNYSDEFVEYMFFRCLSAVQLCMKLAHEETQEDEPEP